jgi:Acyl-CoA reductase (LuxC)
MTIEKRIQDLLAIENFLLADTEEWQEIQERAGYENGWFSLEFVNKAIENIITYYLDEQELRKFVSNYNISNELSDKKVGIIMAGNIPMVGFHDFICGLLSGHQLMIKVSSKDSILLKTILQELYKIEPYYKTRIVISDMLKGSDAFMATGSTNSINIFKEYFGNYPSIVRDNKTSVAVLTGKESSKDLENLSEDIHLYFGLGCRNVTKLYVPKSYDFIPLLAAFKTRNYFVDHHKYKNNYDYNLAIALLNKVYYMTEGHLLYIEHEAIFSPIACIYYSFYDDQVTCLKELKNRSDIQCIVSNQNTPFGSSQTPTLSDYSDGIDVMDFLVKL